MRALRTIDRFPGCLYAPRVADTRMRDARSLSPAVGLTRQVLVAMKLGAAERLAVDFAE
jgi:hypothetical protein